MSNVQVKQLDFLRYCPEVTHVRLARCTTAKNRSGKHVRLKNPRNADKDGQILCEVEFWEPHGFSIYEVITTDLSRLKH